MNSIGFNPDGWLDVFTILAVALVAAVPSWLAARNHSTLKDVKQQVVNGHTATNLRDDIDRAIHAVEALTHDVRSLRHDLMAEEDHRRLQINDLREELDHRTGKHRRI